MCGQLHDRTLNRARLRGRLRGRNRLGRLLYTEFTHTFIFIITKENEGRIYRGDQRPPRRQDFPLPGKPREGCLPAGSGSRGAGQVAGSTLRGFCFGRQQGGSKQGAGRQQRAGIRQLVAHMRERQQECKISVQRFILSMPRAARRAAPRRCSPAAGLVVGCPRRRVSIHDT